MAAEPIPSLSESQECASSVAVLTGENQLTIPAGILSEFRDSIYFEVTTEKGRIVLTPVEPAPIEAVWAEIEARGITEADIADAIKWAREQH